MISDLINAVVSFEKGIDSMRLFGVRTKTLKTEDFGKGIRNWWRSFWCGPVKRIKGARKPRLPGYSSMARVEAHWRTEKHVQKEPRDEYTSPEMRFWLLSVDGQTECENGYE